MLIYTPKTSELPGPASPPPQTRINNRERYSESSSFSHNLMKRQASALRAGGGNLNSDKDSEARTVIRIFNDLIKRKSFRASRGMEGGGLISDKD